MGKEISELLDARSEIRKSLDLTASQLSSKGITVDDNLRTELQNIGVPIYSARSLPFDPSNNNHRKGNQIGLGFPFTSSKYAWPVDSSGEPKQPIIQLDLSLTSRLFGYDLGEGLIQLWVCADVFEEDTELELIHIKSTDLNCDPDPEFPQSSIWEDVPVEDRLEADKEKTWHWDTSRCRFHDDCLSSPLIEWVYHGVHFPKDKCAFKNISDFQSISKDLRILNYLDEVQVNIKDHFWHGLVPQLGVYTNDWGRNKRYKHHIERPDLVDGNVKDLLLFSSQWNNGIGISGVYIKATKVEGGIIDFDFDIYERFDK